MYLGKVIGNVVSLVKHPAYNRRVLLLVKPLDHEGRPSGKTTIAVDYVGAGEGDTVLVGAGPGVAQEVFGVKDAPIRELVMGIIDRVQLDDGREWG